jgi:hypothetical protein
MILFRNYVLYKTYLLYKKISGFQTKSWGRRITSIPLYFLGSHDNP